MNIGLFTDTYFPQNSGVATSVKTLKEALEAQGHNVFIFTTTDPNVDKDTVEANIFRFSSVPFIGFSERRIAFRGLFEAVKVAKEVNLDIVHTQTEFSMGLIGKYVARQLGIPAIHTYHTMYEDYLHYVLNGHLLRPVHVQQFTKSYLKNMDGVIAPSQRVAALLARYGVEIPMRVIPTGVDLDAISGPDKADLREKLGIAPDAQVIITLGRVAAEKKIDRILRVMPDLLTEFPKLVFVIAGDGPDADVLKEQVERLTLEDHVIFAGNIPHDQVASYYKMADFFVSASDTETQGLTYIEALGSGRKCVVYKTDYTDQVFNDPAYGLTFESLRQMKEEIATYLRQGRQEIPPQLLAKKLEEISASHFASEVYKFYQYAIDNYQVKKEDSND
ncbi:glycosyl transferase [Lactobacillus delbrueckii subsp. delbrueckii]|jgi:1,2-diacylglycerol 3-alpha-glucosyltransferase|uniref:glycosyltransferase family 4 protein n=1 Tax=Lactobacillus delbrueckii TaxID=1584 RepID=UPI000C085BF9|nr:glycosyltransferase family 4 protein [Lactobacillus delbrueckii]BBL28214.1 glycosyl transferase [Lactobacillus delbrueckii subsp. delbrueckii]GEA75613.1 glycosyl transferase [Lactobacillus delbrueckii subsp. delbrueckii]